MMMRTLLAIAVSAAVSGLALAALPPPDAATQAKQAEAAARSAWQAKVATFKLCEVQDRIAARYKSDHPKVAAAAAAAAAASAPQPVPQTAPLAEGGGTPVAGVAAAVKPPPPCVDPGPFAYTPAEQKPLESSGAHSPPGNAISPPSVRAEGATMVPAKPSTAPKQ